MADIRPDQEQPLQPSWPLYLDKRNGPFLPITTLIETLRKDFENLLLTNPGEWIMSPDLGVGLQKYVFDNYPELDEGELRSSIVTQLQKFLPSIKLIDLRIVANPDDRDANFARISIRYYIASLGSNQQIQEYVTEFDFSQTEGYQSLQVLTGAENILS